MQGAFPRLGALTFNTDFGGAVDIMNIFTNDERVDRPEDMALCISIWPALSKKVFAPHHYAALAAYASDEIARVQHAVDRVLPGVEEAEKMRQLMAITQASSHKPIEEVMIGIAQTCHKVGQDVNEHPNILLLAASLSAATRIRLTAPISTEESVAIWQPGTSLRHTVAEHFQSSSTRPTARAIDARLTMSYLSVYHRCRVVWTDRLDQHLDIHVNGKATIVLIYQHKIWLSSHIDRDNSCVVPQNVICEALDTLNLLFPHNDRRTESFLKQHGQMFHSLGYCGRDRKLDLANYPCWGDKIENLLRILGGPRRGFWHFLPSPDRLNVLDSANFWIASGAAILAFVGFVLGLMSFAYAKWSYNIGTESLDISKESLELTRLQYILSVAQECSEGKSTELLPSNFCPPPGERLRMKNDWDI